MKFGILIPGRIRLVKNLETHMRITRLIFFSMITIYLLIFISNCKSSPTSSTDNLSDSNNRLNMPEYVNSGLQTHNNQAAASEFRPSLGRGITIHSMIVPAFNRRVYDIINDLTTIPDTISAQQAATLHENSFDIRLIASNDINKLIASLPMVPQIKSSWLGQINHWKAIVASSRINSEQVMQVDGSLRSFDNGTFRILSRAYNLWDIDGAYLYLEMIPQFHQPVSNPFARDLVAENLMGQWITSMGVSMQLDGTQSILLTYYTPQNMLINNDGSDNKGLPETIPSHNETGADESLKNITDPEILDNHADTNNEGDNNSDSEQPAIQEISVDDQIDTQNTQKGIGPDPIPIQTIGQNIFLSTASNYQILIIIVPGPTVQNN